MNGSSTPSDVPYPIDSLAHPPVKNERSPLSVYTLSNKSEKCVHTFSASDFPSEEKKAEKTQTTDTQQNKSVYTLSVVDKKCVHTNEQLLKEAERVDFPTIVYDDRFSIAHTYKRKGEQHTVHYTMNLVTSRVKQYQKKLKEAIEKDKAEKVISNQRKWLAYWLSRRDELVAKATAE